MSDFRAIRQREVRHIAETIKDDLLYNRKLTLLYEETSRDITKMIAADINRFSQKEGVSMAEAKKLISKTDVELYGSKAAKIVEDAKAAREAGQAITRADYTSTVNRELRRYNVTMRTNRLELLQANINAATVNLAATEEAMLTGKLYAVTVAEFKRQAGILGMTVRSPASMTRAFRSTILSDVSGITFSDNIWMNQAQLRDGVNQAIQRALIRGESPLVTARKLQPLIKDGTVKASYAARRIAVTETSRAQTVVQEISYKDAGYTHYVFIAETDDRTCPDCEALDGQVFLVADMTIGENASPVHPNCRCSTSATVAR